jgi:hypothetical protein
MQGLTAACTGLVIFPAALCTLLGWWLELMFLIDRRFILVSSSFHSAVVTHIPVAVDDSTAVIECMLRHPPPYANVDRKLMSAEEWRALRKIIPPPPPHVTAIGYPVEVIGTVMPFHDGRRITAISMSTLPLCISDLTSPRCRGL